MVEKPNHSENNPQLDQLELLRNILLGEFTRKYEKRIDSLEEKLQILTNIVKENKKDAEVNLSKMTQKIDETIESSVERIDKQVALNLEKTQNIFKSELQRVEENKTENMADLADLFVDLAGKIKKI